MPPAGFDQPYLFGVIDLVEGPRTVGILSARPGEDALVRAVPGRVRDHLDGFLFAPVA